MCRLVAFAKRVPTYLIKNIAETIDAGEGIDTKNNLSEIYRTLLCIDSSLIWVNESKYLFTAFSTSRQCIARSIRGEIRDICF